MNYLMAYSEFWRINGPRIKKSHPMQLGGKTVVNEPQKGNNERCSNFHVLV